MDPPSSANNTLICCRKASSLFPLGPLLSICVRLEERRELSSFSVHLRWNGLSRYSIRRPGEPTVVTLFPLKGFSVSCPSFLTRVMVLSFCATLESVPESFFPFLKMVRRIPLFTIEGGGKIPLLWIIYPSLSFSPQEVDSSSVNLLLECLPFPFSETLPPLFQASSTTRIASGLTHLLMWFPTPGSSFSFFFMTLTTLLKSAEFFFPILPTVFYLPFEPYPPVWQFTNIQWQKGGSSPGFLTSRLFWRRALVSPPRDVCFCYLWVLPN